jgi:hypothetical protein
MGENNSNFGGVEDCDKPGGSVKRELIPGSLNDPSVNP